MTEIKNLRLTHVEAVIKDASTLQGKATFISGWDVHYALTINQSDLAGSFIYLHREWDENKALEEVKNSFK